MDGVSRYWRLGISRILARPFWKELKDQISWKLRPNPEESIEHVLFRAQRAYTMMIFLFASSHRKKFFNNVCNPKWSRSTETICLLAHAI